MLVSSHETCPLPEHPVLADLATALNRACVWGQVLDREYRLVLLIEFFLIFLQRHGVVLQLLGADAVLRQLEGGVRSAPGAIKTAMTDITVAEVSLGRICRASSVVALASQPKGRGPRSMALAPDG